MAEQGPWTPATRWWFFDAIRVKTRDEGFVRNKAVYIALGILPDGTREVLGLWTLQTEGAKFWLRVMNELKTRGVSDVLIAVTDGLRGFPEAINAVFPDTVARTCIVHLVRHSLDFISWKGPQGRRARAARHPSCPGRRGGPGRARCVRGRDRGARSTPPSRRPGGGTGIASSSSSPSPRPCAGSSTRRMTSTRPFCWDVLPFCRAVDLVAKRGASAGSVAGQPIQSLPR